MKATLLREIETVLRRLDDEIPYSDEAVLLLAGTCAQESHMGKYRRQLGDGPALGIFQMEPATFNDCVENYLVYRPDLYYTIMELADVPDLEAGLLENNDILAACMCRVKYLRDKHTIPTTIEGQAEYWKRVYNTYKGAGTVDEYIKNFNRFVVPYLAQS